jgi:hypothetical protein
MAYHCSHRLFKVDWRSVVKPQPYDCRSAFDNRVIWALRMVGIELLGHMWSSGRRKDHRIDFSFRCDTEMAKGVLVDLIADEFDGYNCRFFATPGTPKHCYVLFDEGRLERYVEGETHAAES